MDVLLVDDEELIRQGIFESVEWDKLNMTVVGQAEDGEEALELYLQHKPQLILTDIKMPFMDGLELVERVKSQDPDTYIVIISGYDEFQYAQKAIKLGASDFILKPIDLEELEKLLHRISLEFFEKKKRELEERTMKEKVETSLTILQENFLKDIMFKRIDSLSIQEGINELKIANTAYHTVLLVQIDNTAQIDMTEQGFYPFIHDVLAEEEETYTLEINHNELVILLFGENENLVKRKRSRIIQRIRMGVKAHSITTAFGSIYSALSFLAQAYEEAAEALEYKFILGSGHDISYDEVKGRKHEYANVINSKDYDRIYSMDFTDKDRIEKDITLLMADIKNAGRDSYLYSQMIISTIYMSAIKALKEMGGTIEEVFHPIAEFKQIVSNPTMDLMKVRLIETLLKIVNYMNDRKFGKSSYLIEKAKLYIQQGLHDPNFSIEAVARHVNISNSYFSILFKQETGQTFVDYLTSLRMKKAKYLLKNSGYRTYEISDMVGYNNSTYFSTIFKKYTGCTPSEYRKQI